MCLCWINHLSFVFHDEKWSWCPILDALCCCFMSQSTIFSHVWTLSCLPGLNQYLSRGSSVLLKSHNTVSPMSLQLSNRSIQSLTLFHWAYIAINLIWLIFTNELWHGISNNEVCATSKASDQHAHMHSPAHTHSLIRAFASRLNILSVLSYCLNMIGSF